MEGKNPLQHAQSLVLIDRAKMALEHALPRGSQFVCIIVAPGFNTIASNMPKGEQVELFNAAAAQVAHDVFQGRT